MVKSLIAVKEEISQTISTFQKEGGETKMMKYLVAIEIGRAHV